MVSRDDNEFSKRQINTELRNTVLEVFNDAPLSTKPVVQAEETIPKFCKNVNDIESDKQLKLRSSWQTVTSRDVEVPQFDPNFFSREFVACRFAGCNERKPRKQNIGTGKKEDLYLCPSHKGFVEDHVVKMCYEKGVAISYDVVDSVDLKGYTSLIGILENAYISLTTPSLSQFKDDQRCVTLQEVCLNARNYLIIVNTLLNPDDPNLVTSLTAPFHILQKIFKPFQECRNFQPAILQTMGELVSLLREVMKFILFAFGVIFSWVDVSISNNVGVGLGVGIGGVIGFIGYVLGPFVGTFTTTGGAVLGGLIGSSLYNMIQPPQDHTSGVREYQEFARAALNANIARVDAP